MGNAEGIRTVVFNPRRKLPVLHGHINAILTAPSVRALGSGLNQIHVLLAAGLLAHVILVF